MSSEKRFTVEVSESELPAVEQALGRAVAAKPVRRRRAKAVFEPNTGNAALDAFMRRNHKNNAPKLRTSARPSVPKLSEARREALENEWAKEVYKAQKALEEGRAPHAQEVLEHLISLHYPAPARA